MSADPMPPDVPPITCPECRGRKQKINEETGFPETCKRCKGEGVIPAGHDTSNNLSLF